MLRLGHAGRGSGAVLGPAVRRRARDRRAVRGLGRIGATSGSPSAYGHSSYATEATVFVGTVLNPEGVEQTFQFTEHEAHLYYGAIRYDVTRGAVRPFLSAGIGGVTTSTSFGALEEFVELFNLESVTDLILALGGGLSIEVAPRTHVRGDLKT